MPHPAAVAAGAGDCSMAAGRPRGPAKEDSWGRAALACAAVPAGLDVPDRAARKVCAPIAAAG